MRIYEEFNYQIVLYIHIQLTDRGTITIWIRFLYIIIL
jgi:hypothetical protein